MALLHPFRLSSPPGYCLLASVGKSSSLCSTCSTCQWQSGGRRLCQNWGPRGLLTASISQGRLG